MPLSASDIKTITLEFGYEERRHEVSTRSSSGMRPTIVTMSIQYWSMFSTLPVGWWRKLATRQLDTINYGAAMHTIWQLRSQEYLETLERIPEKVIAPLTVLSEVAQNVLCKRSVRDSAEISGGEALDTQNAQDMFDTNSKRERLVLDPMKSLGIQWLVPLRVMPKDAEILPRRFNVLSVSRCTIVLQLVSVVISWRIRQIASMLILCANDAKNIHKRISKGVLGKEWQWQPSFLVIGRLMPYWIKQSTYIKQIEIGRWWWHCTGNSWWENKNVEPHPSGAKYGWALVAVSMRWEIMTKQLAREQWLLKWIDISPKFTNMWRWPKRPLVITPWQQKQWKMQYCTKLRGMTKILKRTKIFCWKLLPVCKIKPIIYDTQGSIHCIVLSGHWYLTISILHLLEGVQEAFKLSYGALDAMHYTCVT